MRRLLSIASLTFLLSALLVTLAIPAFAEEAAPAETEHATDAEQAEEMGEGEHIEDDGEHADEAGEHADEAGEHADEADDDDTDQWLGLKGAAVAGIAFGFLTFFASGTEGLGEEDHH